MTWSQKVLAKYRISPVVAAAGFVLVVTLACAFHCNRSALTIDNPADGSIVPADTPVEIVVNFNQDPEGKSPDAIGVTFKVVGPGTTINGNSGDISPPAPTYTLSEWFTPTEEGEYTITARALGENKSGTAPYVYDATSTFTVVRPTPPGEPPPAEEEAACGNGVLDPSEACELGVTECGPNEDCNATTCACDVTGAPAITATSTTGGRVTIRTNPGPGCAEASISSGATLVIDARSKDEPVWYHVKDAGWVYSGALEDQGYRFDGDPSTLPVDPNAVGCLYCGDGVCSASIDESAATCEQDCPAVCGDGLVTHAEACDPPEDEPGDPEYGEPAVSWCSDSCQVSSKEPPAEPPFDPAACGLICPNGNECPAGFSCVGAEPVCVHPSCP